MRLKEINRKRQVFVSIHDPKPSVPAAAANYDDEDDDDDAWSVFLLVFFFFDFFKKLLLSGWLVGFFV